MFPLESQEYLDSLTLFWGLCYSSAGLTGFNRGSGFNPCPSSLCAPAAGRRLLTALLSVSLFSRSVLCGVVSWTFWHGPCSFLIFCEVWFCFCDWTLTNPGRLGPGNGRTCDQEDPLGAFTSTHHREVKKWKAKMRITGPEEFLFHQNLS